MPGTRRFNVQGTRPVFGRMVNANYSTFHEALKKASWLVRNAGGEAAVSKYGRVPLAYCKQKQQARRGPARGQHPSKLYAYCSFSLKGLDLLKKLKKQKEE